MVTAADMDGEFSSNAENSRQYAFRCLILMPVNQNPPAGVTIANRMEYAEQVIAEVIDEIVNISDTDFELAGSGPTILYVNAADVAWSYVGYEGGEARAAELTLRVYTEKTIV